MARSPRGTKAPWASPRPTGSGRPQDMSSPTEPADDMRSLTLEDALRSLCDAVREGRQSAAILAKQCSDRLSAPSSRECASLTGETAQHARSLLDALQQAPYPGSDWSTLGSVLSLLYRSNPSARPAIRTALTGTLERVTSSSCRWESAAASLVAIHRIFKGLPRARTLAPEHRHLIWSRIVPLFRLDSFIEGVEPPRHVLEALSVALLPVFFEACCRQHGLASEIFEAATTPPEWNPLSPLKLASIIRLAVQLVLALPLYEGTKAASTLSLTLERNVMSSHLATAVAALTSLPSLVPRLARSGNAFERVIIAVHAGGARHWSDEVDRMRKDALKALATASPDRFSAALEGLALKEALSGITEEGESETESGWKSQSSSVSVDDVIHLRAAMRHARFQDFIFGDPIGSGAFATVFRTKLREQHKSQSKWYEIAAKEFSAESVSGMRAEAAVLAGMMHPHVANLLSAFSFRRSSAYLIEEYASEGDLHSLLGNEGSLPQSSARFVIAEIAAGLEAVHIHGFAFGDLKPENVLLTHGGHIKLTDFGGCVPLSDSSRRTMENARHFLRHLKDADWRAIQAGHQGSDNVDWISHGIDTALTSASTFGSDVEDDDFEEKGEGNALSSEVKGELGIIEGTIPYLAPEVCRGHLPNAKSDVFVLGVLLYMTMFGTHPLHSSNQSELVPSDKECMSAALNLATNDFASEHRYPFGASSALISLCSHLLQPDSNDRPDDSSLMQHTFFSSLPAKPRELYKCTPPPLWAKSQGQGAAKSPLLTTRQNSRRLTASFVTGGEELVDVTVLSDASEISETEEEAGSQWVPESTAEMARGRSSVGDKLDEVPESEEESEEEECETG